MAPTRPLTYDSSSESSENDVDYSSVIGSECETCKPSTDLLVSRIRNLRGEEGNRKRRRRRGRARREFSLSGYCLKRRLNMKWLEDSKRSRLEEQWRELTLVETQFWLAQGRLRLVQAELDAKICQLINLGH
ncbi:hypothetical protein FNV43_RR13905 [Rhamnella rubrinervis]|uniref:Uncharacterized protein n=1 Tax=Rhamnella rubrinervis TaxID=2594499 RepID=A0A8K0MFS6_9ROSA|nr:hypothetical protein FNV43_RR13905 [Rhamnella rubrinervis]